MCTPVDILCRSLIKICRGEKDKAPNMSVSQLDLHRGSGEKVSIETKHKMYDHQIEGLRFLFKQWKMWKDNLQTKSLGYCVLNFPPNTGKSVTAVLFLYAIRMLLEQPILMLCRNCDQVKLWSEYFQCWSGFTSEDIAVESKKALINKQVFIKNFENLSELNTFISRTWSIVVVKDEDFLSLPYFPHVSFVIWLTSTDLINDLSSLKLLHKWLLPKEKFEVNSDEQLRWRKNIYERTVLESFILRQMKISSKFYSMNNSVKEKREGEHVKQKRSKNKDPTGLKTKRSKSNHIETYVQPSTTEKADDMDVEAFIRNQAPLCSEDTDEKELNLMNENSSMCEKEKPNRNTQNTCEEVGNKSADYMLNGISDNIAGCNEENIQSDPTDSAAYNDVDEDDGFDTQVESEKVIKRSTATKLVSQDSGPIANDQSKLKPNLTCKQNEAVCATHDISENIVSSDTTLLQGNVDTDVVKNVVGLNERVLNLESDLDSKINEMEEKAMKKFKGSFLDSIL
ncbi:unnamed protein product [Leptosia nina]|uniref:Uncharacterized protein n=1 Tax=Leptosia nina TaxID=320188 RepID=A0AAV1JCB2_9NEOP